MRPLAVAPALLLVLTACGTSGDPVAGGPVGREDAATQVLEATDGSLTIEVPSDWEELDLTGRDQPVIAAQGPDPLDQVLVNRYDSVEEADDQAVFTAAGLAGSGIACERLESSAYGDRLLLDCPADDDGVLFRRMFFPVDTGSGAALVLLQGSGELADTVELLGPVLESLREP